MRVRALLHVCGLLAAMCLAGAEQGDRAYREEIRKWREGYEADLKKDGSWLALAGLYWLKEGENSFGSGVSNAIVLPPGSAPEIAGTFLFHDAAVRLNVRDGVPLLVNGEPAGGGMTVKPDSSGKPDRISLGRLTMIVIQRGARYGIRLWDNASQARSDFRGTRWFPVKESYRITAQFVTYAQPKMIPILNILGDTEASPSPGYATFELKGMKLRLEPIAEANRLFFMFKDLTSGKQTYPAGRFLYSDLPKDGKVALDFNKAENPPCAFTPYATCPLPPRQNHLAVAIDAGELTHEHSPAGK